MKYLAITFAAGMIASSSAFAGSVLFDVNDAPLTIERLDTESTASIRVNTPRGPIDSMDYREMKNSVLFDVDD